MITIQNGSWRRGKGGKYKPFIQGFTQLMLPTIVEVVSCDGISIYVEISGTYKKSKVVIYTSLGIYEDRILHWDIKH